LAACAQPVARMVSRKKPTKQPKEFSKRQLYAILAEAVRNTG
jgi:GcrA cell cycle regulator